MLEPLYLNSIQYSIIGKTSKVKRMGPKTYFIKKWNNNKNSTQPTLQKEKEKRYEKKEQKEL